MRVVSFNIHRGVAIGGRRPSIGAVGDVLRELEPDVIALQEIVRTPLVADQPALLANTLHMSKAFWPASRSCGMSFGNAVLVRGRISDAQGVTLPTDGAEARNVLFVDAELDGSRFTVACTHLDVAAVPRKSQLGALPALLGAVRGDFVHAEGSLVLAGDFNADSAEMGDLAALAGLSLAPECATFPSTEPRFALDRVLVSDHWRVTDVFVHAAQVSDHAALVVDLERVR